MLVNRKSESKTLEFKRDLLPRTFGYDAQAPNLSDLLIRLLVGDMANTLRGDLPSSLQHFRLQDQLAAYDAHSLLEVMTFEAVERQIIRSLRSQIIQEETERFDELKSAISANAAMVFVGNINQSVDTLLKTSHLFAPFPEHMIDTAFFDRMHCYIPGWEIPKMRPEFFTNLYGLTVDYLAEYFREMRKTTFADAIDTYFLLGNNLNQRDTIAVRKTVSGLLKLLYPHGDYDQEAVEKCLHYALECRRRVKEQLKRLGGMEFYDVHFSYIDQETREEKFVGVPEQGGSSLIPEGPLNPGTLHTVGTGSSGQLGLY